MSKVINLEEESVLISVRIEVHEESATEGRNYEKNPEAEVAGTADPVSPFSPSSRVPALHGRHTAGVALVRVTGVTVCE